MEYEVAYFIGPIVVLAAIGCGVYRDAAKD
jgi:hypothetical protein